MSITNNIVNLCIAKANLLIHAFPTKSFLLIFLASLFLVIAFIASTKFKRYTNPYAPKKSAILREAASWTNIISLVIILAFIFYLFVIYILTQLSFSLIYELNTHGFFNIFSITLKQLWPPISHIVLPTIHGGILGMFTGFYLKYYQIPDWEKGEGLSDVNDIAGAFSKLNGFDPTPYINPNRGCFIGMSLSNKPIYLPWQKVRETHIQVLGTTGVGKGVVMSSMAYQCILAGESLVWFDPKFDLFSPRVLADAAKKANKKFHFINLNPDQPPQLNPIAGSTVHEIEELLVSAFDLRGKGTDGDFHRGKDEDAAIHASKIAIEKDARSIPDLIRVCRSIEQITTQENFWRKLTKLGDLNVIKTNTGLDLKKAILSGDVIYIVGSTDNERVKMLQKLVLVRVNQIIKKKNRFIENIPTCIVLDEFKFLLSPIALSGLSVIRGFNAHCLLSHQSLGDLDSCPGITRAEAEGAVLDNTAIKVVYRIGDSGYAEKLSKNSGKKRIFVEQAGKGLDQKNQTQGGWKETNIPLVDPDLIMHLPMPSDRKGQASVGVILGVGVSKIFYTGHLPCRAQMPVVKAVSHRDDKSGVDTQGVDDDLI